MDDDEYFQAIHKCCERYRDMISERTYWDGYAIYSELDKFNFELMFSCRDKSISIMKANRWLGYIQGVLIEKGLTTVKTERDWTRGLFKPLDETENEE